MFLHYRRSKNNFAKAKYLSRIEKPSWIAFKVTSQQAMMELIPVEFYKVCWDLISDSFIRECAKESNNCGEMPSSQRKAVITLIEKQGKDRILIENWRPISVINVDAKIISKVIAARIKKVLKKCLPSIIHHNQTGYVNDRFIGETVRSILDIMEFTDRENIPGILIFIDFKKAFDTLEWNYLVLLFCCASSHRLAPGVGPRANLGDCKMGSAKLRISPRGGGGKQNKVPWVKCFSTKNLPDIHLV